MEDPLRVGGRGGVPHRGHAGREDGAGQGLQRRGAREDEGGAVAEVRLAAGGVGGGVGQGREVTAEVGRGFQCAQGRGDLTFARQTVFAQVGGGFSGVEDEVAGRAEDLDQQAQPFEGLHRRHRVGNRGVVPDGLVQGRRPRIEFLTEFAEMALAGRGESFGVGKRALQSLTEGRSGFAQGLEVSRAPARDFGDVAVVDAVAGGLRQLAGFEAELLLERRLLVERLAERPRLRLALFQVGRVTAAFEFIQRAAGGLVVIEFDEPGGFGEAAEGLFFLLALQVDGDDGAHDEQQADDP